MRTNNTLCNMQKRNGKRNDKRTKVQVSPLFWFQATLDQIVAVSSANAFQHDPPMLRKPHLYVYTWYIFQQPNISSIKRKKKQKKKDIYINDQIAHDINIRVFPAAPSLSPLLSFPLQFCTVEAISITTHGPAIPNPTRWPLAWPP